MLKNGRARAVFNYLALNCFVLKTDRHNIMACMVHKLDKMIRDKMIKKTWQNYFGQNNS